MSGEATDGSWACPRCGATVRVRTGSRPEQESCAACAIEMALGNGDASADRAWDDDRGGGGGWRFGGYEILGELGRGGMGVVYRARQVALDRVVALKMPRTGPLAGPEELQRFRTEAMAAARLRHPGIVAIHEIGEESGQPYFSMDLVEGPSLAALAGKGPMRWERAARLVAGIAEAVQFAHEHGVLHRDLKPSNVLVGAGDVPHVTDFGVARLMKAEGGGEAARTATGTVVGSPAYMPPEQALGRGAEMTVRSDVYALGAILYELLTGRPPFEGTHAVAVLKQVIELDPTRPRQRVPALPLDVETVCLRCLSKRAADRYASATEVAEELGRCTRGEPILARPVSRWERLVRWYRREPLLAGAVTAALVLSIATAGVSTFAAWRIDGARRRAETESGRAQKAEAGAREQLRVALLAQARASRFTGRFGQRRDALGAATAAAAVRPGPDAREEAVAALALPELVPGSSIPLSLPADRLAFDPDRDQFVADEPGNGLVLRRIRDGAEIVRFGTGGQRVTGFPVFGLRGTQVASRLADGRLCAWRTTDGTKVWEWTGRPYPDQPRTTRFGEDLVYDPAGAWFAAGLPTGGVTFHDPVDGRELRRWASTLVPRRAAASADGRCLALGDFTDESPAGAVVIVVHPATGAELGRMTGMSGVRGLAWSSNAEELAVARAGRVEVLRWPGGELHRRLETPDGPAMDLAWSPSGEWLLTHSSRAVFRWWNVREGRVALETTQPVALAGRIAVSGDFRSLAVPTTAESQRPSALSLAFEPSPVYRSIPPPPASASQQVASSIGTLDFSPDGGWISVACLDEVHVRERATGSLVARITRPGRSDWSTARFGRDRTTLFVSSRARGLLRHRLTPGTDGTWTADAGELVDAEDDYMLCAVHRPSGRLALASARKHKGFKLLSMDDLAAPPVKWASVQAYEVAFSPDGRWVVGNSVPTSDEREPRRIEVRRADTGEVARVLDAAIGATARWSGDGRWLVAASLPDRVELWRTSDWTRGPGLAKAVQSPNGTFALSPDGEWLAAFNEVDVMLVSTRTGEVVTRLPEPPGTQGYVTDMAFGPDGRTLALLRRNAVLALWDVARLREELGSRGLGW